MKCAAGPYKQILRVQPPTPPGLHTQLLHSFIKVDPGTHFSSVGRKVHKVRNGAESRDVLIYCQVYHMIHMSLT